MSEIGQNKVPLKVGITGGIGSGKTTVCKIFESLEIPIYYADDRAKALMVSDPAIHKKIISLFGKDAYQSDGSLNRQKIAAAAFHDKGKLAELNAVVHPVVIKDAEQWHQSQHDVPYTLKEAALLFESGSYKNLDKIVVVHAPEEVRVQRVVKRDKVSEEDVKTRIARQMPAEEKLKMADYVIYNDGSTSLIKQVLKIHRQLLDKND